MAAAVSSLVHNYMIPILHCEHIRSCAFVGNWPSRKVHVSRSLPVSPSSHAPSVRAASPTPACGSSICLSFLLLILRKGLGSSARGRSSRRRTLRCAGGRRSSGRSCGASRRASCSRRLLTKQKKKPEKVQTYSSRDSSEHTFLLRFLRGEHRLRAVDLLCCRTIVGNEDVRTPPEHHSPLPQPISPARTGPAPILQIR